MAGNLGFEAYHPISIYLIFLRSKESAGQVRLLDHVGLSADLPARYWIEDGL